MSLYLVEVRVEISTQEKRAKVMERIEQVVKEGGTPTARLVAGPWASMENPTVLFVFENPDLNQTMPAIMELFNEGLISDSRMRPIMDWEGVKAAAAKAGG
jgi:hypothetical protein